MATAAYLATIARLRARPFPAGRGYHLAELSTSEDFWEDDGTRRREAEEQYEAECEALAAALAERWGEPQMFSLWSVFVRGMEGEEIPEPWAGLSNSVPHLYLWRVGPHWIALGVSQWDKELPFQLLAAITETNPP
ncbi:hypothetical protein GCM10020367_08030 [Streptomyces sannanensis]|uniref:Uncharacterized protein n=1 Tax=Streptomyces sannanensis TaxID=285536 RepID=A0ABP6S5Q8_9ACTN